MSKINGKKHKSTINHSPLDSDSQIYDKNDKLDWEKIILNLKSNGFNELSLMFDENDNLYFDKEGAVTLRCVIFDLINSNCKKQDAIDDATVAIGRMKSKIKDDSFILKQYEEVIRNLNENLLEVKQKLKEVQSTINRDAIIKSKNKNCNCSELGSVTLDALEESRQIVVNRYHNLERICDEQRGEINALQLKLTKLNSVEKSRNQRQQEIFHQLRNKAPNCYNALDKRLLDIIESYENKVLQLESHLAFFSSLGFNIPFDDKPMVSVEHSSPRHSSRMELSDEYKQLIKKLQEEIENVQKEKQIITEKLELMKLESESKPTMLEMKEVLNKLKEYKRLLEIHNISPTRERSLRKSHHNSIRKPLDYPNSLQDIEFLPYKSCQKYLIDFCTFLNSKSINDAFNNLSDLLKMNALYPAYFGICSRLLQLIETPGLPILVNPPNLQTSEKNASEVQYTHIIDVVETWVLQLCSINQLISSVDQLRSILMPWKACKRNMRLGLLGVIDMINEILDQCQDNNNHNNEANKEEISLTFGHAKGLVEHFQKLFECPKVIGVYSRMNVVYSKYSEMQNVIDSLKKILNIEDQRGLACLIAEVDALDQMVNSKCRKEADQFQFTKDIEILIEKLEKYEAFFPEFESLIDNVLNLLGQSVHGKLRKGHFHDLEQIHKQMKFIIN